MYTVEQNILQSELTSIHTAFCSSNVTKSICHVQSLQGDNSPITTKPAEPKCKQHASYFYIIQSLPAILDSFQELVEQNLKTFFQDIITKQHKIKRNITKAEKQALKQLSDINIVICSADKGKNSYLR